MPNGTPLSQMTIEEWLRQAQALGLRMTPTPPAAPKSRLAMALENALLAGSMAGQTGSRDYGIGGAMQGISGMLQLRRQQERERQAYPGQAMGTGLQALERLLNLRKLAQPEKPQEPFASSPLGIYNQMTGEITKPAPAPTPGTRVVTVPDAQGNPVTQIVPNVAGTSFPQPIPKVPVPMPGRDVPFPPAVQQQKIETAGAMAEARGQEKPLTRGQYQQALRSLQAAASREIANLEGPYGGQKLEDVMRQLAPLNTGVELEELQAGAAGRKYPTAQNAMEGDLKLLQDANIGAGITLSDGRKFIKRGPNQFEAVTD